MNLTINTENKEQADFLIFLAKVSEVAAQAKGKTIEVQIGGQKMTVSQATLSVLTGIYQSVSKGKSVTITEKKEEITTQEAAAMLNVSRPYLIKLLDKGELPFRRVGKHRRIPQQAVEVYKEEKKKRQEELLSFLAKEAQELNLGY